MSLITDRASDKNWPARFGGRPRPDWPSAGAHVAAEAGAKKILVERW